MLTQISFDKKRKSKISLQMSTFWTGVYSSGAVINSSLIEHNIIESNNFNLTPLNKNFWSGIYDGAMLVLTVEEWA